ncbi:hypothetical protein [Streptomyces lydicus]|uniref:hypothetical protein n=1 Tax=Streptomyces lydicus TaxID=47763 RepID=UPI0036E7C820
MGVLRGLLCPECQTPEENAEAEVKEATLDYAHMAPDDEGRQQVAPIGGWHTVIAMEHPLVREDKSVHLALSVESAELRVAVGSQSDARLHELFDGACATVVRAALDRKQAQPGQREIKYTPMDDLGADTILLIEDHALCEDGEDRGELMLSFSPSLNPHLLDAFAPPVAEVIRSVLRST